MKIDFQSISFIANGIITVVNRTEVNTKIDDASLFLLSFFLFTQSKRVDKQFRFTLE